MAGLTRHQLRLLAKYLELESYEAVAKAEGLSTQTVRNQLSRVYRALNARSGLSAARELGWIQVPSAIHRDRRRTRTAQVDDGQTNAVPSKARLPVARPLSVGSLTGFGYQGLKDGSGLYDLLGDDIDLVVDVRITRRSRIRAFSTMTPATVEGAGYAYRWLSGLGNAGHLDGGPMRLADPAQVELVIRELQAGHNVAVMCVCSDVRVCHRRLVIQLAQKAIPGLEVRET